MRQEREWARFKMGGNGRWVLVKGRIEAEFHVAVTDHVYLNATILNQTLSDTAPKKTPP